MSTNRSSAKAQMKQCIVKPLSDSFQKKGAQSGSKSIETYEQFMQECVLSDKIREAGKRTISYFREYLTLLELSEQVIDAEVGSLMDILAWTKNEAAE